MTVTFRRHATNRFLGLLTYAVIVPVVGLFLVALIGGLATVALKGTRFELLAAPLSCFVLAPLTLMWLIRFAIYDYRRRAAAEVTIGAEQIVITTGDREVPIPLAEVSELRLTSKVGHHGCRLILANGQRLDIPSDLAPYADARAALEKHLLPLLMDRIDAALATGETIHVRDNRLLSAMRILIGILLMALSLLAIASIHFAAEGFSLLATGKRRVRSGWRGLSGGFVVSQTGVRAPRGDRETLWEQIASVCRDECGIVLQSEFGERFCASMSAAHGWEVGGWLIRTLPRVSHTEAATRR